MRFDLRVCATVFACAGKKEVSSKAVLSAWFFLIETCLYFVNPILFQASIVFPSPIPTSLGSLLYLG